MREGGSLSPVKLTQLVLGLLLLCNMIPLCGLHSRHDLLHSLQHLRLHDQHLLQRGWWCGGLPWLLSLLTLWFLVFAI
jgi:fumarate reductase subunit D